MARATKLSLPIPMPVLFISFVFPILASALVPLAARYFQARNYGFSLPTMLTYLFSLPPLILIVLASVFGIPSSLLRCSLEGRWQHLFQIKDDQAIRAIQDTLRCCGLNSVRDRAWPFPSSSVDAGTCAGTQGWTVRCLDPWRRQASATAGVVGLANLSSWALILLAYVGHIRPLGLQGLRSGTLGSNHRTRLLGALGSGDEEVREESDGRHRQPYHDIAEGGGGHGQEHAG